MVTEAYSKYDIIIFPKNLFNNACEEDEILYSNFLEKGYRVFYFNIIDSENYKIEILKTNLYIVNIGYGDLTLMTSILSDIIKDCQIKESLIYAENPRWHSLIDFIKTNYYAKVVFYHSNNFQSNRLNSQSIKYIYNISNSIFTSDIDFYKSSKDKINITLTEYIDIGENLEKIANSLFPKVNIVIISYNNLPYTKLCIDSILQKTAYPNYEIIIVDNNSEEKTKTYLQELKESNNNITVIFNQANFGFAKANNIGIANSKGKFIILLNNDTIVTRGWIGGLVKYLERDKKLALVGPVTNNCGNESRIDIEYSDIDDMDVAAEEYTSKNTNNLYTDINMLAMFCVTFRKELIDEIGYIDECFGIGMFEDDDFSLRVKLHGYKLACAEDVFIHHYGSASFSKLHSTDYVNLFNENKEIFEAKWNKQWVPHKYRNDYIGITTEKPPILFFSVIDWDFRYQRPQHIASYFAKKGHRVYYINANFKETDNILEEQPNLELINFSDEVGKDIYSVDMGENIDIMKNKFDLLIKDKEVTEGIMISEYPNWYPINEYLKNTYNFKLVSDYLDDFSGFNTSNSILSKYNDDFLEKSDLVIASSNYLYKNALKKNIKTYLIPNGTEHHHFKKALKKDKKANKNPNIGYYGAIAEWFDVEKVAYIAEEKPEWNIILIGDVTNSKINKLKAFSNIKLLGEKNYNLLPSYLNNFDVCIIPFSADMDLIKATNPIKFYEYLSAGKKIVATEIPDLENYNNVYAYLTNDNQKFIHYIEECLREKATLASLEERLEFAAKQDWSLRCIELERVLKQHDILQKTNN
jgi:GT2 family glycosyltransferase